MASPVKVLEPRDLNREHKPAPKQEQKKKEKLSALCKTPPALIRNKRGRDYHRGNCLGEGGFARCFQVKDDSGKIYAAKTVAKESMKSEKTKKKLLAEIKIHKSLNHPNVVQFVDCFEDETNVYILLEICPNQSLMDMLKKRKRFTEPEAKYFITQIIGAVTYMHDRRVIHRDLKLGNIFLDEDMNAKIGDFGLATLLASSYDRKKTICGTPNYIAPEILYGKEHGHSYEVDIWSIGIILYAMLFGKPPFQSKDVDVIYERIKKNDYKFPEDADVSPLAKDLISSILNVDPEKRPSLSDILEHEFFDNGPFPSHISKLSLSRAPSYKPSPVDRVRKNFADCKIGARLITKDADNAAPRVSSSTKSLNPVEITRADIEAEKPQAILPNSLSPASTKEKYKMIMVKSKEIPSFKKHEPTRWTNSKSVSGVRDLGKPKRTDSYGNVVEATATATAGTKLKRTRGTLDEEEECDDESSQETLSPAVSVKAVSDGIIRAMSEFNDAASTGNHLPRTKKPRPAVFVTKWVDYSNKYGLAYQLSDGTVGVLFRDNSTVLMDASETTFVCYEPVNGEAGWAHRGLDTIDCSQSDAKRIKLVKSFHKYMQENLSKCDFEDKKLLDEDHIFITNYNRTSDSVMFQLNNFTFQFNFPDHCKLILSKEASQVDLIDASRRLHSWNSVDALLNSHNLRDRATGNPKYNLMSRFEYCQREIEKKWMEMVAN
jgi:cell cycle serine/threonine-protein kinase CDC5/MSD2